MSRRTPKRMAVIGLTTAAVVAAGLAFVPPMVSGDDSGDDNTTETTDTTENDPSAGYDRETVQRRTLEESTEANGSAGFGAARQVNSTGDGIVTEAPEPGDVLGPGDVLIRVAQRAIVLVQGTIPMYRELRRTQSGERDAAGDKLGDTTGGDVQQLQDYLIGLGLDEDGDIADEFGTFGKATEQAVELWQRYVGHPATGKVDSSQMVFVPDPIRIESAPLVGARFEDPTVTDVDPKISANVTAQQRSYFELGNEVEMEFADRTVTGTVTDVDRQTGSDGSAQFRIEITPDEGSDVDGIEADATAKLIARRVIADDVLTVPVRALVALAEGGWAVQVDSPNGPKLTAVELGEVVDGFAEVSGLAEGDDVLVATT